MQTYLSFSRKYSVFLCFGYIQIHFCEFEPVLAAGGFNVKLTTEIPNE